MSPHGRTRTDATLSRRRQRMHTMASQRTTTAHPSASSELSSSRRAIGRRQVLGASGAGAAAAALAACTGGGQSAREASEAAAGDGTRERWDQCRPRPATFEDELDERVMTENAESTIDRQQLDSPDRRQALQIARRRSQRPDVQSLAGLDSSPAALPSNGWFQ